MEARNKKHHKHRPKLCPDAIRWLKCQIAAKRVTSPNPLEVVIIGDATNFDDFVMLILLAKATNIRLRIVVVDNGFNDVGPSVNNVFNLLSWLRDDETEVINGSYFSAQEVENGPYPGFNVGFNPPRVGQVAMPFFQMYIPPLWKDNGATLYGTVGKIPLNNDPERQYRSAAHFDVATYVSPIDKVHEIISSLADKTAIIINTGSLTTLDEYLIKYQAEDEVKIRQIYISGGGFFFPEAGDVPVGLQAWNGNIFSARYFLPFNDPPYTPCEEQGFDNLPVGFDYKGLNGAELRALRGTYIQPTNNFTTMQEFNIFLDPQSAQNVFDRLQFANIETFVVPLDATGHAFVGANTVDILDQSKTYEGRYVADLLRGIELFEGGPEALDGVIRLWDIVVGLVLLEPNLIRNIVSADIKVVQLDAEALKDVHCPGNDLQCNPYDVLQTQPYVGQTQLTENPDSHIRVILSVDVDAARQSMITRLQDCLNSAYKPPNY